jgi:hypothetical protein
MKAEDKNPDEQRLPLELTAEQLSLLAELEKIEGGRHLDRMLIGAIHALRQEDNPESLVHAAQSVRELMEKFEQVMHGDNFTGSQEAQRPTIKSRVDVFANDWSEVKSSSRAFAKDGWKGRVDAPLRSFLEATDVFFERYAFDVIYRKNKETAVVHKLDPMFSTLSLADQNRVAREWVGLRKFFNGVAHHREEGVTKAKMEDALARLVRYLHRRLAPVDAKNKEAIRAHITDWEQRGVTDEAGNILPGLLDSGADMAFFFATIEDGKWLPVLRRAGYFKSPPPPEYDGENVRHPWWPQSVYLLKASGFATGEVATILSEMPETANLHVGEYILRAAAALPPEHVGPVVSRVHSWIKTPGVRFDSHSVAKFIRNVARSRNIRAALAIFVDVLCFTSGEKFPGKKTKRRSVLGWLPDPQNRLDSHEYSEFLKSVLPTLTEVDSPRTILTLCRILAGYIRAKGQHRQRRGYDGSCYWRPAIDETGQQPYQDNISHVISALRKIGDDEIRAGRLSLATVITITNAFQWDLFRRLELHWMKIALDQVGPGQLRTVLVKRTLLRSGCCEPEYGLLLQASYASLKPNDRQILLRWIAKGPAMSLGKSRSAGMKHTQDARDWADKWRTKKAYWIKDHLPAALRAKYDSWVAKGWEPQSLDETTWGGQIEGVAEKSPIALAEFESLPLTQQADYLRSWMPAENTWNDPSRGGLAGTFRSAIVQKLPLYLEQAHLFIGVPPEYVAAFFSALGEKLKDGVWEPMAAVWVLARWMLQQSDDEVDVIDSWTNQTRRDRRWYSARIELARLILYLLRAKINTPPALDRENIWALIEVLAADPDPSAQHKSEEGDDQGHMGPFALSLNSIRGEAFHAVFEYIFWCRRSAPHGQEGGLPIEAKRLLEKHLDPAIEPTLTIRSVYGANVTRMVIWDAEWFRQNRNKIFPGLAHPRLDAIAWKTFISHSQAYIEIFDLIPEVFHRAVLEMTAPKTETRHSDPRVMLGNYLVTLYWRGQVTFSSHDGLLTEFFKLAPDDVRAGVIEFIGHALQSTGTPIEKKVADRLCRFWEWRIKTARSNPKGHASEVGCFAWWFHADKLDSKWSAEQMLVALELSHRHENQFLWMKQFSKIAESETDLAVQGLELTVKNTDMARATFWSDEEAAVILKAGLKSSDPLVVDRATRVKNALLRIGRIQFLDVA